MDPGMVAETVDDRDTPNFLALNEVGQWVAATGQTIKGWVRSGRFTGYRIGAIVVLAEAVEAYVAAAGSSLDLPEVTDEEAAALVEEARGKRGRGAA